MMFAANSIGALIVRSPPEVECSTAQSPFSGENSQKVMRNTS